jgi:hypothetical protein
LDDDSIFTRSYMQLVTPGMHGISDSESDNGGDEQREENVNVLLRVTWVASLFRGSLLGDSFVNTQQYCRRC